MKELFFKPEEDFKRIIYQHFSPDEITEINKIPTGWTNIVFEVNTKEDVFFFRFPRDNFWAKMMLKDYHFCEFIKGKTSFKTPDLKLCYDNERPYSLHQKIEGTTLTEVIDQMGAKESEKIAKGIIKFILELKNIDVNLLPKECNYQLLDFLDELCKVHFDDLSLWHQEFFKNNNQNYIVHGDLNPGNVLVNDNYEVIGILDFCFSGTGNPCSDIGWFISRSPNNFKVMLIKEYEKQAEQKIDNDILEGFIKAWLGIGEGYSNFIRKNNPDIVLPS